jgi:hypothetical protein
MADYPVRIITVPVDLKGHTANERFFTGEDGVVRMKFVDWGILPPEEEMFTDIEHGFSKSCSNCGGYIGLLYDKNTKTAATNLPPCRYTEGLITRTEVEFPAGKILVSDSIPGNWTRAGDVMSDVTYNSKLGQSQTIVNYALHNTAFGPTGNEGLGLYKVKDGHYRVINPGYVDDTDEVVEPEGCVASICTDLWAYSIVDYQKWLDAGNEDVELNWGESVVEILPGRYRFTYYGRRAEENYGNYHIYCDMELLPLTTASSLW